MTEQTPGTPDYTMGFSEDIVEVLKRSTVEDSAAYLLPHLRPGLRVLDFGCGPGTVSVGLARAVAPGELHGVDMEKSQIELAKAVAEAHGQDNTVFHVGDVLDLPFTDGFFDVAHCHNVLMHIPDTHAALTEVKRVLKPGGIMGCREMICESSFAHPDASGVQTAWRVFEDLVDADDGHAQMGKDVKNHLIEAGFVDVRMTAEFHVFSEPEELDFFYGLVTRWFLAPEITGAAIKYGAATARTAESIRAAYEAWREHPGAFAAIAFGQAVAVKP